MSDRADLRVIGAGFGRTGTLSLKFAFEQLGWPCHHMFEVGKRQQLDLWTDVVEGRPDWHTIFRDFRAAVDFPSSAWYDSLMEEFPDAKVLLSVRDSGDQWYESAKETILFEQINGYSVATRFQHLTRPQARKFPRMLRGMFLKAGLTPDVVRDRAAAVAHYDKWVDEVRKRVPAERLLVFNVKEGWGPFCNFLGLAVPETPFPHVNETAQFKAMRAQREHESRMAMAKSLGLASLGAGLVSIGLRKARM